jgi:hypothetical protein
MRFLHLLAGLGLAACGGSEFTTTIDAGGMAGRGGDGSAGSDASTEAASLGGSSGAAGRMSDASTGDGRRVDAAADASDTGAGGARNSGDCDTRADCGGTAPCVELAPGGYRVCALPVPAATSCSVPAGTCCKSSDCNSGNPNGKCVLGPDQRVCSGLTAVPANVCVTDECQTASDCSGGATICAPPGTLGNKAARCFSGGCVFDRDCTQASGGICAPVVGSCCSAVIGLYCVYPDGCRRDSDCGTGQHCSIQGNRTTCVAGLVACPASQ